MKKTIILGKKFDCKFDFRETCFAICNRNEEILLTQKNGDYSLPGGGIESGETNPICLERELMEECGYSLLSCKELCTVDCYWLAGGKWPLRSLANFFTAVVSSDHISPLEQGHRPVWVKIDEVKNLLSLPYQVAAFEHYLAHKENI